MRLVFVYGPPAVGKLTVSTELARLTGFRLFDNHVSVDFARTVFDFGTPPFWKVVDRVRREVIEDASREGIDVIFTFVYAKPLDDNFVREIAETVRREGGSFCPVRLRCSHAELLRRVSTASRRARGKLATKAGLADLLRSRTLGSELPVGESLTLDTGKRSPREAARAIMKHYGLGGGSVCVTKGGRRRAQTRRPRSASPGKR